MSDTQTELLRFATSGSVDDGKSTLIGRLLVDTKGVYEDQLDAAKAYHERKGGAGLDLALITDGLQSEREQGITIDVAYRYFATPKRKFIIADTPGHEQYTRNMVTGASTANLAIVLLDARKGILTQSRRHTYLAHLLGIPHLVAAINKMDLVDFSQTIYDYISQEFRTFAGKLGIPHVHCIPMSALQGDMVVARGDNMPWYQGKTLLETLETVPIASDLVNHPFRFPVQLVNRPQGTEWHDFRGYMGRIESGEIQVGDPITVLPVGLSSQIKEIVTFNGTVTQAFAPQSVTLTLAHQIDISRGDMLVQSTQPLPQVAKQFNAKLCWLNATPLELNKKYLIKQTTNVVKGMVTAIDYQVDINTLERYRHVTTLHMNEIARVTVKVQSPLVFDYYADNRTTGSFILIDVDTNNTVAGGMIEGEESSDYDVEFTYKI